MYYIGLNSVEESLSRIANRVKKGGHDIPKECVIHRYNNRIKSLESVIPLCDKIVFYDNENGFAKVAHIHNSFFSVKGICNSLCSDTHFFKKFCSEIFSR